MQMVAVYLVLALVMVGVGLLIAHTSMAAGLRRWDVSINRWFVRQRVGWLDFASNIGSHLGETLTVVIIGIVVALILWRRRDFRSIGVLGFGLTLEVGVFLTTTLLVDRHRPPVRHLDIAPPTSSFPSGHTAAAMVLYVGLALILSRHLRTTTSRVLGAILLLVPIFVALSRLYRGMHHPSDVIASVVLGAACLLTAVYLTDRLVRARPTTTDATGDRARANGTTRTETVTEVDGILR